VHISHKAFGSYSQIAAGFLQGLDSFTLLIPEGITFKSSHTDKSISVISSFSQFSIQSRVDCFLILKVVPISK
jgi:hypothetical protein